MQAFTGTASDWNHLIAQLPDPHFLQTREWAQVKEKYGWTSMLFVWYGQPSAVNDHPEAAAMILKRTVSFGGLFHASVLYTPKGPLMDWENESLRTRVLNDLQAFAKKQGAIFLKLDPDVVLGTGIPGSEDVSEDNGGQVVMTELKRRGWKFSSDQIQFRNTVIVDLSASEEDMLVRMKQKTRYNVRLAEKKGVTVRVGTLADLPMLHKMYAETSVRDGFVIRDEGYYQTVWGTFMRSKVDKLEGLQVSTFERSNFPTSEPIIAEVNGEPVAAIFVFYFVGRAYYVYGMSKNIHREKMPMYLLQWEAMKRAKNRGCKNYDLWGAPEEFNENDSMWGVYRFKEGLGGQVVRTLGAWDYMPNAFLYKMYAEVMSRVLDVMRSRGKDKTKQIVGGA